MVSRAVCRVTGLSGQPGPAIPLGVAKTSEASPRAAVSMTAFMLGLTRQRIDRKNPVSRAFSSGSDGTGTRDLRRDRPVQRALHGRRPIRDPSDHKHFRVRAHRSGMAPWADPERLLPVCCPVRPIVHCQCWRHAEVSTLGACLERAKKRFASRDDRARCTCRGGHGACLGPGGSKADRRQPAGHDALDGRPACSLRRSSQGHVVAHLTFSIGSPARCQATNPPATSAAPLRRVAFDRTACWQR